MPADMLAGKRLAIGVPDSAVDAATGAAAPARNPLELEYGGGAVEHALTCSVRDSADLLDAT